MATVAESISEAAAGGSAERLGALLDQAGRDSAIPRSAADVDPIDFTEDEETLIIEAQLLQISNAEAFARGGEILIVVKKTLKRIKEHYKRFKDPINALRNAILEMEKADADQWAKAEERLSPLIAKYDRQQKEAAEQQRLREQAEEDQRALALQQQAAAAVRRVAEAESNPASQAALREEAKAIEQAPIVPRRVEAPPIQRVAGLSTRWEYRAELVDPMQLIQAIAEGRLPINAIEPIALAATHPFLDGLAKSMGPALATLCAGIKVVKKDIVSGR